MLAVKYLGANYTEWYSIKWNFVIFEIDFSLLGKGICVIETRKVCIMFIRAVLLQSSEAPGDLLFLPKITMLGSQTVKGLVFWAPRIFFPRA